jgi:murein DD-endopeptidase MepM/ murein hydrolase activator NlpD
VLAILCLNSRAAAQSPTPPPPGPIYVVQPNEYLSTIAERFNVSLDDLMAVNQITNPNLISEGQRLVIPGLQGITGILDSEIVNFGDSFHSLLRRTQIPIDVLQRLNHVVSPTEFYVGADIIIPKQDNTEDMTRRLTTSSGQSLFELALLSDTDAWTLSAVNALGGSWDGLPGDVLYAPGTGASAQAATGLPPAFEDAQISTLPLKQGATAEITVTPVANATVSGTLADYPLHFFPMADGRVVTLQGIHAMLDPGVYPLQLDAKFQDGTVQSFQQLVLVEAGSFPPAEALPVPPESIDPAITGPEDQQVMGITAPATNHQYWTGQFRLPVGLPYCIKDWFGRRRSFNGSAYIYFHSGVDYGVCSVEHPFDVYATAPGVVVFAGPLNVRGNATFIDHGWGVYSGYFHQEAIYVTVGQQVEPGQLIGKIGATGRVTGPHLHFDLWVGGIQVNPLDWLSRTYP